VGGLGADALGADKLIAGVCPTDTPIGCVFGEGVPSTDTLTSGAFDEDASGTDTLTKGVPLTATPIRGALVCAGAIVGGEDASGELGGSSARPLAAPGGWYRPTSNTTATPAPLNRTTGCTKRGITHEPWRG
jgi:hypothetical protein